MTPAEFEWRQEQAEIAFEKGRITAGDFRQIMQQLGFGDRTIDEFIEGVERRPWRQNGEDHGLVCGGG